MAGAKKNNASNKAGRFIAYLKRKWQEVPRSIVGQVASSLGTTKCLSQRFSEKNGEVSQL
jgi:hypothetical protein